jgi:hypothetical protein
MGATASKHSFLTFKNDYELVIKSSKELEHILEHDFGGRGKGLHEKASSASNLTPQLVKDIRYLVTVRNKLIHECGFDAIPDRDAFIEVFERAVNELDNLPKIKIAPVIASTPTRYISNLTNSQRKLQAKDNGSHTMDRRHSVPNKSAHERRLSVNILQLKSDVLREMKKPILEDSVKKSVDLRKIRAQVLTVAETGVKNYTQMFNDSSEELTPTRKRKALENSELRERMKVAIDRTRHCERVSRKDFEPKTRTVMRSTQKRPQSPSRATMFSIEVAQSSKRLKTAHGC